MLTATTDPQSVLVLGATSDIATAIVQELAARASLERVVLAGRPGPGRDAALAAAQRTCGSATCAAIDFDAVRVEEHESTLTSVFEQGDIDVVVLAFGVLPTAADLTDPVAAAGVVTTNFTGAVSALVTVACALRAQGHGSIIVLSSVAGERPRRSNYLYGSTKAGLDAFATGLGDDLVDTGVEVIVVRPGYVHSSMTAGLDAAPLAVHPGDVARAVVPMIGNGSRTVWAPRAMRPVMSALRHLPRAVFRRLPL